MILTKKTQHLTKHNLNQINTGNYNITLKCSIHEQEITIGFVDVSEC